MKNNNSRRDFIKLTGLGLVAGTMTCIANPVLRIPNTNFSDNKNSLTLGLASFSLRNFDLTKTIEMTKRLGLKKISLKSMHLPLESSKEDLIKAVTQIKEAGLELYGAGVIYLTNEKEIIQAFEYAKTAGLEMIIAVPEHNYLKLVEEKVKEYNIKVAIHNHGPEDKRFPSPESVYEKIKNMDRRIGLCLDIGHTARLGIDPSEPAKKYFDRLMDIHIKDENESTAKGNTVEIGRGVIDIPKFLRTIIKLNYKGVIAFEFEKDKEDPLPGLSESIGYVKGVLSVL